MNGSVNFAAILTVTAVIDAKFALMRELLMQLQQITLINPSNQRINNPNLLDLQFNKLPSLLNLYLSNHKSNRLTLSQSPQA